MVEPLRDEVVQQFGVDQLSVIKVQTPEGEHHKLQTQKSAFRTAAIQTNKLAALQSRTERCIQEQWENCPFESKKYNGSHNSYSAKHHSWDAIWHLRLCGIYCFFFFFFHWLMQALTLFCSSCVFESLWRVDIQFPLSTWDPPALIMYYMMPEKTIGKSPLWWDFGNKEEDTIHVCHRFCISVRVHLLTTPKGKARTANIQSLRPISFLSCLSCSRFSPALVIRLETSISTQRAKNTAWITCNVTFRDDRQLSSLLHKSHTSTSGTTMRRKYWYLCRNIVCQYF